MPNMTRLLKDIKACSICAQHLPFSPKPLLQASTSARLLIAGQAPGLRAHQSGVLFDDRSGERLRQWLGLSHEEFYDRRLVAINNHHLIIEAHEFSAQMAAKAPQTDNQNGLHCKLLFWGFAPNLTKNLRFLDFPLRCRFAIADEETVT